MKREDCCSEKSVEKGNRKRSALIRYFLSYGVYVLELLHQSRYTNLRFLERPTILLLILSWRIFLTKFFIHLVSHSRFWRQLSESWYCLCRMDPLTERLSIVLEYNFGTYSMILACFIKRLRCNVIYRRTLNCDRSKCARTADLSGLECWRPHDLFP